MRKGTQIWLSRTLNENRDLKWTWELQRKGKNLVGTNSVTANLLIWRTFEQRLVHGLRPTVYGLRSTVYGLRSIRRVYSERTCQPGVRIDLEVITKRGTHHFIEEKNCHLRYPDGYAYFPDSKTLRSIKHLRALRRLVRQGHQASLFVAVQRADVRTLRPSDFHDAEFSKALQMGSLEFKKEYSILSYVLKKTPTHLC